MTPTQLTVLRGVREPMAAVTNSKAAAEILAVARRIGLPMPRTTSFGTERLEVGFGFETVDELARWSEYLGEPIAEGSLPGFHLIDAVLFDHGVYCYCAPSRLP